MLGFFIVAISVACNNLLTCLVCIYYPSDKVWFLLGRRVILVLNSHNFVRCHFSTWLYGYCNWDLSRRQAYFLVQTVVTVSHFCAGVRVVCKLISDLVLLVP